MRGKISLTVALVALSGLVISVAPAAGTSVPNGGAGNVQFDVEGTLHEFPCPDGCTTSFSGNGSGVGNVPAVIDGEPYNATFTILDGAVEGTANYTEPGFPFCPFVGTATSPTTGSVTLSGGATGIIFRTDPLIPSGTVHTVTTTLGFSYQRVGVTPAIRITGGEITLEYFIPGTGSGSFTRDIAAGAGGGVFDVDEDEAVSRCLDPGELDFVIHGDAAVATQEPV